MTPGDGPVISFRPLARSDFDQVSRWLAQPHIARWWNEPPWVAAIEAHYGPAIDGDDPTAMVIAELDATPAGLFQHYRHEDYPDHDAAIGVEGPAAGMDYLLGVEWCGRGLGCRVIDAFVNDVVVAAHPRARWVTASPAQANRPSWRSLEKAGFERRGPCWPPDEPIAWAYARRLEAPPA